MYRDKANHLTSPEWSAQEMPEWSELVATEDSFSGCLIQASCKRPLAIHFCVFFWWTMCQEANGLISPERSEIGSSVE